MNGLRFWIFFEIEKDETFSKILGYLDPNQEC